MARFAGLVLGAVLAVAIIVAMQVPLLGRTSLVAVHLRAIVTISTAPALAWPSSGPAAVEIPSLGVVRAHDDAEVPIASLTKMMTAYVALRQLPLSGDATGPCLIVSDADVELYNEMSSIDESSVRVAEGEQLCENVLLSGMLVHSAGNYAVMLADLVAGSSASFVTLMNEEALHLGLDHTHYDDVTGYSALSESTASDQVRLAALLMRFSLVRATVDQTSVTLPVAGTVASFTPDVGLDGVVGIKSGRTDAAGGCDALALHFIKGTSSELAFVVVLDQRGGDLLGPAGDAALALANSAVAGEQHQYFAARDVLGTLVLNGRRVGFGLASSASVPWWPVAGAPHVRVSMSALTSVQRGALVGHLVVHAARTWTLPLVAFGSLHPPTLIERLR